MAATKPAGVHLVGSLRLPDGGPDPLTNAAEVEKIFHDIAKAFPKRLRRISDGEPGDRQNWILWQVLPFLRSPWIMLDDQMEWIGMDPTSPLVQGLKGRKIELGPSGYDFVALKSWESFQHLQAAGVIEPETRFLVCIPAAFDLTNWFVKAEYRVEVEPLVEDMLRRAIRSIQAQIPAKSLAIQFDIALELAVLECESGREPPAYFVTRLKTYFEPTIHEFVQRFQRVADVVLPDVELGFHLCYGDYNHKHNYEPRDTGFLAAFANAISKDIRHSVDFIHMPVPKSRTDDAYFEPLKTLKLRPETELYLGLVHAHDAEGTDRRIAAAQKVAPHFGVSTECGWGRTPSEDIASIIDISNAVAAPL